jgi:hypothetical protein
VVGGAGTVAGATVNLTAGGGIGIGTAVDTNATTLALTSNGAGAAGNITVVDANSHNTTDVTLSTMGAGQTVDLTADAWTVGGAFGDAADNLVLRATTGSISGANTLTAIDLILEANAANQFIGSSGSAINTNISGTLTANAANGNGGIFVSNANALNVGTVNAGTTGNVGLTSVNGSILDAGSAITANNLTLNAAAAGQSIGTNIASIGTAVSGTLTAIANNGTGGIYISDSGTLNLATVDAGTGGVDLFANNDILSSNGVANDITAANATLTANSGRIGASASSSIGFSIPNGNTVVLNFAIPPAYIDGISSSTHNIQSTGLVIIGAEVISNAGTASTTELKDLGYVDWSLFSEDLNLFGVVEPGIQMPADQVEDELVMKNPLPNVEFPLNTLFGWDLVSGFKKVSLQPAGGAETTGVPF